MNKKELGYQKAFLLATKIHRVLNCNEALAVALTDEPTKVPRPDLESTVVCKNKIPSKKYGTVYCAVIDGSPCPLNLPIEKVS